MRADESPLWDGPVVSERLETDPHRHSCGSGGSSHWCTRSLIHHSIPGGFSGSRRPSKPSPPAPPWELGGALRPDGMCNWLFCQCCMLFISPRYTNWSESLHVVLSVQQGHTNRLLAVEQNRDLFYNKTRRLTQNPGSVWRITLRETRGELLLPTNMAAAPSWSSVAVNPDLREPPGTGHVAACRTLKHPLRTSTRKQERRNNKEELLNFPRRPSRLRTNKHNLTCSSSNRGSNRRDEQNLTDIQNLNVLFQKHRNWNSVSHTHSGNTEHTTSGVVTKCTKWKINK